MNRDDDALTLLLVDGDNLLHRLRGARDDAGLAWLIPRLRAALPAGGSAIVMLDGHPDAGEPTHRRVAPGVEFRHSLRVDADTAIVELLVARSFADRGRTAVITDDRALTERARRAGGLTRRLDWLRDRLERPGGQTASRGAAIGQGRAPRGDPGVPPGVTARDEQPPWKAGRGATTKHGNPRRGQPRP